MKSVMVEKKYTKIYFRVLPMEKMTWEYLKIFNDQKTVYIRCLQELSKSKEVAIPTFWTFRTDQVFFNHTQSEIYNTVIPEVLDNISHGHDALIMAYGQTGTGKSLTINGLYSPYQDRGILPRLTSDLFNKVKTEAAKTHTKLSIHVSYIEFARNTTNDLLKSYPNKISELEHLSTTRVTNVGEVLKIIFRGEGRKAYSDNDSYGSQSFSSIFTFYIVMKSFGVQDELTKKCKLHIIDLAGSDTIGNLSCLFKKPQEVGTANLAKTQLEQFFLVLASDIPEQIKVKQRLNPMIHYLGESLKKTTILRFIGHIRTSREDLLVTISMLRFGELISGLKATKYELKVDEEVTQERMNALQNELNKLQIENRYNNMLMHQDLAKSLNEERYAHIERTVNEYLQNKITQLTLLSVCDITIALETLKVICEKNEKEKLPTRTSSAASKMTRPSSTMSNKVQQKSSRSLNKTSSSSGKSRKKNNEETGSLAISKKSSKTPSVQEVSKQPQETSNSNVSKRRSSTGRKKSQSIASIRDTSSENVLSVHIPPDHKEAWELYLHERSDEYVKFVDSYKLNEAAAKTAYRTYLAEVKHLKEISAGVDKHRNDLFMVKMTREFQQAAPLQGSNKATLNEYEECCKKELQKAEQEQLDKQELVLKCQAEIKAFMNVCQDQKNALHESFNAFCQDHYQVPVVSTDSSESMAMNIEEVLRHEEAEIEEEVEPRNAEADLFESFKLLIEIEKKKIKMYQTKHKEWLLN